MIHTKTFWIGIGQIIGGTILIAIGSEEIGALMIANGLAAITGRHATLKLHNEIKKG